jgi:hypothetical protein
MASTCAVEIPAFTMTIGSIVSPFTLLDGVLRKIIQRFPPLPGRIVVLSLVSLQAFPRSLESQAKLVGRSVGMRVSAPLRKASAGGSIVTARVFIVRSGR